MLHATLGDALKTPGHRSFFRDALAKRARRVDSSLDPVHEMLVDQSNLRGFRGAVSSRDDLGQLDPNLGLEEIVVGLLMPQAPAEVRIFKLVTRILQSGQLDLNHLLMLARRERALEMLDWLIHLVPDGERTDAINELTRRLEADPPRSRLRPELEFDPRRLARKPAGRGAFPKK